MTSLVHHAPMPELGDEDDDLYEFIEDDIRHASRKSRIPIIGRLQLSRYQRFYVLDAGATAPREVEDGYQDIQRSAVHLPPTPESAEKLKKALKKICPGRCTFVEVRRIECLEGYAIFYVIKARINPNSP